MQVLRSHSTIGLVVAVATILIPPALAGQTPEFSSASELARYQYEQGAAALESGDQSEAERLFLLSIRSLDGPQARLALSALYYAQGRMKESFEAAGHAVRRSAGDQDILRRALLFRTRASVSAELPHQAGRVCDELEDLSARSWSHEERSQLAQIAAKGGCDLWLQAYAEERPSDSTRWRVLLNVLVPRLSESGDLDAAMRKQLIRRFIDVARAYAETSGDGDVLAQVSWSLVARGDLVPWMFFLDALDDGRASWWHYRAAQLAYVDGDLPRALTHLSEAYRIGADDLLFAGLEVGFKRVCARMQGDEWAPDVCSDPPEMDATWVRLAEIAPGSVFSALPSTEASSGRTRDAWRRLAERQPASLIPQGEPK